jgi:hypothetical protein
MNFYLEMVTLIILLSSPLKERPDGRRKFQWCYSSRLIPIHLYHTFRKEKIKIRDFRVIYKTSATMNPCTEQLTLLKETPGFCLHIYKITSNIWNVPCTDTLLFMEYLSDHTGSFTHPVTLHMSEDRVWLCQRV